MDGVPISATANYEDFNEKRSEEFRRLDYRYSRDVSVSYFSSSLSAESRDAYEACLQRQSGLYGYVKSLSAEVAEIRVGYVPPPGGGDHPVAASAHGFTNVGNQSDIENTIKNQDFSSTVRDDVIVKPSNSTKTASFELARGAENVAIIVPPLRSIAAPPPPPVSLIDAVYHGAPILIVFELGYGTCAPGYIYHGQYNSLTNSWTVTGYNAGDKGVSTYTYSVGPRDPGYLDVWGGLFTFNDDGIFYDRNGSRRIGTIRRGN